MLTLILVSIAFTLAGVLAMTWHKKEMSWLDVLLLSAGVSASAALVTWTLYKLFHFIFG